MRISLKTTCGLMVGDLLLFLFFSWWGRVTHQLPVDFISVLFTAFPFVVTWVIVAPTFSLYQEKGLNSLAQTFYRTSAAVWVSITAGVWLRAMLVNRNVDWLFFSVTMVTMLVLMLGWRLSFTWFFLRSSKQKNNP